LPDAQRMQHARAAQRTRRAQWLAGVRGVLPAAMGTLGWGIVTGIALVKSGLSVPQALALALLVYSGTALLASLPLLAAGAAVPVIWLAALLANLRFVVYSAVVAGEFRRIPALFRLGIGHLTTDSSLAAYLGGSAREPSQAHRTARYLGSTLPVFIAWKTGTVTGVLLAGAIPTSPKLSYFGVLAVLAIVGPMLRTVPALAAAAAAGAVAIVGRGWPYQGGMLAAIAVGVAVALVLDRPGRATEPKATA
jgi:predicted branched-subunit amino acid permease